MNTTNGAFFGACLILVLVVPYTSAHVTERPLPPEFRFASDSLFPAMLDTARASWLLERLRPILAKYPNHAPFRQIKFWALANSGASAVELAALTDSLVDGVFPLGRRDPPGQLQRATHCLELGQVLFARRDLASAEASLRRAITFIQATHPASLRTTCEGLLGQIGRARAAVDEIQSPPSVRGNAASAASQQRHASWFQRALVGVLKAGPGAFVGAFAAFFFYRLGDFVLDRYRRKQRHHSALVRLEWLFNTYHTQLTFLAKRIGEFQTAAEKNALHRGRFRPFEVDTKAHLELLDLALINALFIMNDRLKSVNNDIEDLMEAYYEAREAFLAGEISEQNFRDAAKKTGSDFATVKKEVQALVPEVARMHAWIRLQAQRDTPRMWIAVNTPRVAKVAEQEIQAELAQFKVEQEKSIADSRARRERIHGDG